MKKITAFIITAAALFVFAQSSFAATEYWVSADGNDNNPGTESSPFATIEKAKQTIRQTKPDNMTEDIVVYIKEGKYYHEKPVVFNEKDSGTDGFKIIYKNAPGAKPENVQLIGGVPATEWYCYNDDDIYYTDVGAVNVWTLYEDGQRAIPARYPNFVYDENYPMARAPYLYARSDKGENSTTYLTFDEGEIPSAYQAALLSESWAKLHLWSASGYDWYTDNIYINSINRITNKIYFTADRTKYSPSSDDNRNVRDENGVKAGSRYFIMNVRALLDAEGEFYMNPFKDRVYYKPRNTENLTNGSIIIPKVSTLLLAEGSSEEALVKNIQFEGLTIRDTNTGNISITSYASTGGVLGSTVGGAGNISLKNAENIVISGCIIKNSGKNGIYIDDYCKYNTVKNCLITNIGYNGINFHGKSLSAGDVNTSNTVTNCRIDKIGETDGSGNGIIIRQSSNNIISHCHITNTVRAGIGLYGISNISDYSGVYTYGNHISYMLFEDCIQDSGDNGVVYINRPGDKNIPHTNTFEQILIDGAKSHPQVLDVKPDGVYADIGAYGQVFKNIEVRDVQRYSFVSYKYDSSTFVTGHTFENVSWNGYNFTGSLLQGSTVVGGEFDSSKMEYDKIGLTKDFPFEY